LCGRIAIGGRGVRAIVLSNCDEQRGAQSQHHEQRYRSNTHDGTPAMAEKLRRGGMPDNIQVSVNEGICDEED
jgi:hypothetical protein